ncbi:MAG TPA: 50S ribosomal protein L25 [Thermoanaerobaculia bacterium]|nr:50S ribosomal protein L25 [Thermoanaerobaculia bacterium]
MAEITLEVVRREEQGKNASRRLRRAGKVPAVVYGGGKESVPITVDRKTISDLIAKSEHGVRSIFLLSLAGNEQKRHAMIKDVQIDPIKGHVEHIDFVRVVMDRKVKVAVPVHLNGVPDGVKNQGGILEFQVRELHVECLPGQIPDSFEVDVSPLGLHGVIRIEDLPIPDGVTLLDDPERVVVSIGVPRAEVVEVEVVPEVTEAVEPELIKRGKPEEEEAEEK